MTKRKQDSHQAEPATNEVSKEAAPQQTAAPAPAAAPQAPEPGKEKSAWDKLHYASCTSGGGARLLNPAGAADGEDDEMLHPQHVAIIGATSAMAEHCARLWAERAPQRITLIARSAERLARIAGDLRVRAPAAAIETLTLADFCDAAAIEEAVARTWALAPVDLALVAHGMLAEQEDCQNDVQLAREMLMVNGVSPALFAEALVGRMQQAGSGALAVIGSVAGDRGRKANYTYGAGKGLVERYMQGLQHRLAYAGSDVRATLIKPGPTDTPMTAKQKAAGARMASVETVAAAIVRAVDAGKAQAYVPGRWALIMAVIRNLPSCIFNRLNV